MKTVSPSTLNEVRNNLISLYNEGKEELLEQKFYEFIASIGIDVNSDEFEELTNGGGVLSSEEMIKVIESL